MPIKDKNIKPRSILVWFGNEQIWNEFLVELGQLDMVWFMFLDWMKENLESILFQLGHNTLAIYLKIIKQTWDYVILGPNEPWGTLSAFVLPLLASWKL